jgi:acyl-CoA thioesterase
VEIISHINRKKIKYGKETSLPPGKIVEKIMERDLFSQWLGIEIIEVKEGYSKIKMTVRKEMINGLGVVHGGICFSLADSCFAFACNNRNQLSLALDTAINF